MRCVIVVHPYPFEPEDSVLLKQYAFLVVRKKMCRRFTFLSGLAQRQTRDAVQETKNEISDSTAYITETHQTMWSFTD